MTRKGVMSGLDRKGGSMSKRVLYALKERGEDKKVKIEHDGYSLTLFATRNGRQWSGFAVDDGMLSMVQDAITDYFHIIDGEDT